MDIEIIRANKFCPAAWSGGETTQLYIYPKDSSYAERNFGFRLSTASVIIESSTFTSLAGISRTLMVLEGKMALTHEGHHHSLLNKFETDQFEGEWITKSEGCCTDFNLMTKPPFSGNVTGKMLAANNSTTVIPQKNNCSLFLYLYKGSMNFALYDSAGEIDEGDLLVIQHPTKTLAITALKKCEFVICEVGRGTA